MRHALVIVAFALVLLAPQHGAGPQFVERSRAAGVRGQTVIRHNVWVEIPELDTDRDGVNDRIRVQVSPAGRDRARHEAAGHPGREPVLGRHTALSAARHQRAALRARRCPAAATTPAPLPPPTTASAVPRQRAADSRHHAERLPELLPAARIHLRVRELARHRPLDRMPDDRRRRREPRDEGRRSTGSTARARAFDVDGAPVTAYWTTGATAMIGTSYVGTLPIGAATLGVEGLKAIVPIAGVSSYYDHRRSYGTVINSFPMIGTDADTLFDNILSRQHPEACACMRERIARDKDRETGDYNAFWDERNYVKDAAQVQGRGADLARPQRLQRQAPACGAALGGAQGARRAGEDLVEPGRSRRSRQLRAAGRVARHAEPVLERTTCSAWTTARWTGRAPSSSARTTSGSSTRTGRCRARGRRRCGSAPGAAPNGIGQLGVAGAERRQRRADRRRLVDRRERADRRGRSRRAGSSTRPRRSPRPCTSAAFPSVSLRLSFDKPAAIVSAMLVDYKAAGDAVHRHARLGRSAESRVDLEDDAGRARDGRTRSRSSCSRTTTFFRPGRASASWCCRAIGCSRCVRRPARG